LRAAAHEVAVFVPVDCPLVPPSLLRALGEACDEAAATQTGPLPCALARSALPVLERRLAAGELAVHGALAELRTTIVEAEPALLANVNAPADLAALQAEG
jgi:molybdopterin-guanine dinucleotide biosynthesis protein A